MENPSGGSLNLNAAPDFASARSLILKEVEARVKCKPSIKMSLLTPIMH
jgi:hypothetical protein